MRALEGFGYKPTEEIIGIGTIGTVYRCGHKTDKEKQFALKVIDIIEWNINRNSKAGINDPMITTIRTQFLEIRPKLLVLDHKNICKLTKIHCEGGAFRRIYLITPLAEMNLDFFLTNHKPLGVPEFWAQQWFRQLVDGIDYLHKTLEDRPFTHSNVKPENILLFRKSQSNPSNSSKFSFVSKVFSRNQNNIRENDIQMIDEFELKLTDCGFESFLPSNGNVITKRDPPFIVSPPNRVRGKGDSRIFTENQIPDEKMFDDIYHLGIVLILLVKGSINRLIKSPKDTERVSNYVTGIDGFYVRFDNIFEIAELPGLMSLELMHLLKHMLKYEPFFRYDIQKVKTHPWLTKNFDEQEL